MRCIVPWYLGKRLCERVSLVMRTQVRWLSTSRDDYQIGHNFGVSNNGVREDFKGLSRYVSYLWKFRREQRLARIFVNTNTTCADGIVGIIVWSVGAVMLLETKCAMLYSMSYTKECSRRRAYCLQGVLG